MSHDAAGMPHATVSIRQLVLSGQPMSLAVYRQLPVVKLIHPFTGVLNGTPWGKVHCAAESYTRGSSHLHLVWQDGNALRKTCIRLRREGFKPHVTEVDEYADALPYQGFEALPQLFITG
jgi:hypothetical protein